MRSLNYFFISFVVFNKGCHSSDFNAQIVGGAPTDIKDIPYQLSVQIFQTIHICGASIIDPNWAISAAHCFARFNVGVSLVAGSSFLSGGGYRYNVDSIISHPQYNSVAHTFDVSLIRVTQPFALGLPGINCIPLANGVVSPGTQALVTGWGSRNESGATSNQLQKVSIPIISNGECNGPYSGIITEQMLCAGLLQGGKDACQGDSGGPLVAENQLVGIVSFGVGCGRPNYPGVYANVYNLEPWILQQTGNLKC